MRNRADPGPEGSLARALAASSPAVAEAVRVAHGVLAEHGIPHLVVGGLALSAHAQPRATLDVDFLVPAESVWRTVGAMVIPAGPFPMAVGGVRVDYLDPHVASGAAALLASAVDGRDACALGVIDAGALAVMKLVAGRPKDHADVCALLDAGLDPAEVEALLDRCEAPEAWRRRFARARAETGA